MLIEVVHNVGIPQVYLLNISSALKLLEIIENEIKYQTKGRS